MARSRLILHSVLSNSHVEDVAVNIQIQTFIATSAASRAVATFLTWHTDATSFRVETIIQ